MPRTVISEKGIDPSWCQNAAASLSRGEGVSEPFLGRAMMPPE